MECAVARVKAIDDLMEERRKLAELRAETVAQKEL